MKTVPDLPTPVRPPVIKTAIDAPAIDKPRPVTIPDVIALAKAKQPEAPAPTPTEAKAFIDNHVAQTGKPLMLEPLVTRVAKGQPVLPSDKAVAAMPPPPASPAPPFEAGGEASRPVAAEGGDDSMMWLVAFWLWQRGRKAS